MLILVPNRVKAPCQKEADYGAEQAEQKLRSPCKLEGNYDNSGCDHNAQHNMGHDRMVAVEEPLNEPGKKASGCQNADKERD